MELKSFQQIPSIPKPPPESCEVRVAAPATSKTFWKGLSKGLSALRGRRELVAGGDIKWKPVDKAAAMLLSKASHIAQPMSSLNAGGDSLVVQSRVHSEAERDVNLAKIFIKASNDLPKQMSDIAQQTKEARELLASVLETTRGDMIAFMEEIPKTLQQVRAWRQTLEREKDMGLRALRELRQFFLEDAHEKEVVRLSEFVRLCERLRAVVDDGTMEKVTDVMLKLSTD